MANSAAMKMIVGSTWKAKITHVAARLPRRASALMTRAHTGRSPSDAEDERRADVGERRAACVTAAPSVSKTRWPIVVFSTISAKTICSVMPQPTVRQSMARRADELT